MKKIFAVTTLSVILLTSCFQAKSNKSVNKVEEKTWNELFQEEKALDPYGNFSITIKNGGKICFGNQSDPDVIVKVSNGNIYVQGYQDNYYVVPTDSYDAEQGVYKDIKWYYTYYVDDAINNKVWHDNGLVTFDSLAFIAYYATPALQIKNLIYDKFTYDEELDIYKCDALKSKGYGLPNDPEFNLKDLSVSFKNNKITYIDYFITEYNTKITASFYDYGVTEVPSIESLMQ